jgi:pimeloyl-ACP methyl ester carboxylesterase
MNKGGWLKVIVRGVLFLTGLLALAVAVLWWVTKPNQPDEFYTTAEQLPARPGVLLKVEPFTKMVPANAKAWRILYTTTRFDGSSALASGIVLASTKPSDLPASVIAWTHGTTGFAPGCAPSVLENPFANVPALTDAIENGWVVVATDYIGLGTPGPHPYLIGEGEGRSALDSIRALRQMKEISVGDKTVVWGHSQGGNAAMWTGILEPSYAPEIKLDGVVAAAPASDLPKLIKAAETTAVGKMMSSYIISAYSGTYADVKFEEYVPAIKRPLVRDMATRCMEGTRTLFMVGEAMVAGSTIFAVDPTSGPLGKRLEENIPTGAIQAPLMIAQGSTDELVLPVIQNEFIKKRCESGVVVDYRVYNGEDHLSLVADDSPFKSDLLSWTKDRFEGKPATDKCETAAK